MHPQKSRILSQGDYKKSRFVTEKAFEFEGVNFLSLRQNMYGGFIVMEEESWRRFLQNPHADPPMLDQFIREAFLVSKNIDEATVYRCWRNELTHRYSEMRSHSVMTRQCNFRCSYCILDPKPEKMSGKTALLVDRAWTGMIKKKKPDRVRDVYSGGEVLLNLPQVLDSAARRFFFCMAAGIDYGFWIITNGSLLASTGVSRMKEVGLEGVRVSIAGSEPIHNRLRPFQNGDHTYERIMTNLEAISSHTRIVIESQYDAGSNADYLQIPEMLDDLLGRGIAVENVHFTPILPRRGQSDFQCGMGDPHKLLFLMHEAERRGFPQFHEPPSNGCMTDCRSNMVFDTDGTFLSCPSTQKELTYGNATRGIDVIARSQLLERQFPNKCLHDCDILPLCNGGCRLSSLTAGGAFAGVDCHYEALRLLLDEHMNRKASAALRAHKENTAA